MKNNDNTKKPSLQVSQETANFIGCLEQTQILYSSVYAALENVYGDQDAQQLINSSFYTEYKALERRISDFLVMSISEKIGDVGFNEI
jgi:hypothetical protein